MYLKADWLSKSGWELRPASHFLQMSCPETLPQPYLVLSLLPCQIFKGTIVLDQFWTSSACLSGGCSSHSQCCRSQCSSVIIYPPFPSFFPFPQSETEKDIHIFTSEYFYWHHNELGLVLKCDFHITDHDLAARPMHLCFLGLHLCVESWSWSGPQHKHENCLSPVDYAQVRSGSHPPHLFLQSVTPTLFR